MSEKSGEHGEVWSRNRTLPKSDVYRRTEESQEWPSILQILAAVIYRNLFQHSSTFEQLRLTRALLLVTDQDFGTFLIPALIYYVIFNPSNRSHGISSHSMPILVLFLQTPLIDNV